MRLIDLDQTIFVPIVGESNGGVEYEVEMTIGEMFDKFLDGFKPEIVDAVPVEWLENKRENLVLTAMVHSTVYGDNSVELCHAVNVMLDMWQKEQEERT